MWEGFEPLNSLSIPVLTLGKRSRRSLGKETPYLRSHHTLLQGMELRAKWLDVPVGAFQFKEGRLNH